MSDSDLSEFLPYLLFQAAELTSRDFQKRYQSRYGMLRTEWRVLFHLGQTGKQTAKQICELASLHKTKVSRAVSALERKRFIRRETHPDDKRSEFLTLTRSGKSALAQLSVDAADFDTSLIDLLGQDCYLELIRALKILVKARKTSDR